jgi:hypothetical protein
MLVHDWSSVYWHDGFRSRRPISQGAVRPFRVVVFSPAFDDYLGFSERVEDLPVQQFVPEPSIEALDVAILPWAARLDEGGLGTNSLNPGPDILSNELRSIVAADKCRWPAQDEQVGESVDDVGRVQPSDRHQSLAQAVQPHSSTSGAQYASTCAGNHIRETPNKWPRTRGLDKGTLQIPHLGSRQGTGRSSAIDAVDVYFCDPHAPSQRGSNENTNRLFREYLPRGTDLSVHSQAKLSAIARPLNERPRETSQYQTPAERFARCVASIS